MTPPDPGAAWRANAEALAAWLLANLAVRVDRYGYHKPKSRAISAGPLTPAVALAHVHARCRSDIIGSLTVVERNGVCYSKEAAVDIDAHGAAPAQILANEAATIAWYDVLVDLGYDPLLTTEGYGSFHLRALHQSPQEARVLQALGRWLVRDWQARGVAPGADGKGPEIYPKQFRLTGKRCGNWLRWPGRHPKHGCWSQVWDGARWLEGQEAINHILNLRIAETLHSPLDLGQYLLDRPKPKPKHRQSDCTDYVWPADTPPDAPRTQFPPITQDGTPTWTQTLPHHLHYRGKVDFDEAAQKFDLATYLGLDPEKGGKVLCPAHDDHRPSMSIYHAHDRWYFRCWACGVHGDGIAYLAHTCGISRYAAARRILTTRLPKISRSAQKVSRPPAWQNPCWQAAIVAIIEDAHEQLLGPFTGKAARAYLHSRGLTDATITRYRLGWLPAGARLSGTEDMPDWPQGIIVPRGIVIPWLLPGRDYTDEYNESTPIYAGFNVRRVGDPNLHDPPTTKNGDPAPKYISAQGSARNYPYPQSTLTIPGAPLLVVEGEFDALLALQTLGERFNVVTWSSASADPAKIHVPDEFRTMEWYLLFDADPAGSAAALAWRDSYPTAHILDYPVGVKDFGELVRDPVGLERWLEHLPAANSHLVRNSS